ncbi:MAG: tetratricopeptide repeat protein [Desulfurivibrio sp.]|nr:MAG: tetratricopeptide repeat protein [Desulfurivibrio sp.]
MRLICIILLCTLFTGIAFGKDNSSPRYAGSSSCMECHERFYQLWSTSMHGLAMQPYSAGFAEKNLTSPQSDIGIGTEKYRADLGQGVVIESGREGSKKYKIEHVLGGKNVFYFLTPFDKGKLQTLPVAYDVEKKEWFDTAASGMRHFPSGERGEAGDWREYPYTFNTACYNCHVSQLSTNYDLKTDTYHTTWAEPGINCETCHGPATEHNKIAKLTAKGEPLPELRIISTKTMTTVQRNDLCLSCHAKANPLAAEYQPKERFYDYFDLITLEDADFYVDGRDLGENYTGTSWNMSPCVKSGEIDCMHCHTSSGRYRFKLEKFNNACLPCHEDKVKDPAAHTHHAETSEGSKCISCHMPKTFFARMSRSDHSMLPPVPSATMAYKSPNACNICHQDKEASWADALVRKWRTRDYQQPILKRATLIDMARKRDWTKLPEMLASISDPKRDEVFAASLIRLIPPGQDQAVKGALLMAAKDPSPLVRGAAVQALGLIPSVESLQALVEATADDYRLVRVRAAAGIANFPGMTVPAAYQSQLGKANNEYLASLTTRPDQWTSHYNLGNYLLGQGEPGKAIVSYQTALQRDPQAIMAMVNMSIAHAQLGESDEAEKTLLKALKQAPDNAEANFNMGLLRAEKNDLKAAEDHLKKAFTADPQMAQAAYNLCIITAQDRIDEAVSWCRKASNLRPQDENYGYTLAFYLSKRDDKSEAMKILNAILEKNPRHKDAEALLKEISR